MTNVIVEAIEQASVLRKLSWIRNDIGSTITIINFYCGCNVSGSKNTSAIWATFYVLGDLGPQSKENLATILLINPSPIDSITDLTDLLLQTAYDIQVKLVETIHHIRVGIV